MASAGSCFTLPDLHQVAYARSTSLILVEASSSGASRATAKAFACDSGSSATVHHRYACWRGCGRARRWKA